MVLKNNRRSCSRSKRRLWTLTSRKPYLRLVLTGLVILSSAVIVSGEEEHDSFIKELRSAKNIVWEVVEQQVESTMLRGARKSPLVTSFGNERDTNQRKQEPSLDKKEVVKDDSHPMIAHQCSVREPCSLWQGECRSDDECDDDLVCSLHSKSSSMDEEDFGTESDETICTLPNDFLTLIENGDQEEDLIEEERHNPSIEVEKDNMSDALFHTEAGTDTSSRSGLRKQPFATPLQVSKQQIGNHAYERRKRIRNGPRIEESKSILQWSRNP